ncbi:MAG: hypothetical protein ACYC91_08555 [Solirubrobacteraceae bacterium]
MWLFPVAGLLVVLGLLGGAVAGGIYTIVLIPLGAIALLAGLAYSLMARQSQEAQGGGGAPTVEPPLPSGGQPTQAQAPSTPEQLTDARRVQQ